MIKLSDLSRSAHTMALRVTGPDHAGVHGPAYIARSEVCVDEAGECIGKGLFSRALHSAGKSILTLPRPLIGSLNTERLRDTCANCFTWTQGPHGSRLYMKDVEVFVCAGCKRFRYCSKVSMISIRLQRSHMLKSISNARKQRGNEVIKKNAKS